MSQQQWDLAQSAFASGNWERAEKEFAKLLLSTPRHPGVLFHLGLSQYRCGKLKPAIETLRKFVKQQPEHAEGHNNLGNALARHGEFAEAIGVFRRALDLNRDYVEAMNNLGNVLRDTGKIPEAIAYYREALAKKSDYADAWNNLGIALSRQGQIGEAKQCYEEALRIKPELVEAVNNLGIAHARLGELAQAINNFERALQLKPDYADAHCNLGVALVDSGKTVEAISSYEEAIRLQPRLHRAHNNLGNLLAQNNNLDEAIERYRQAIHANPEYAEAHNNLGNALRERGTVGPAIESLRRAIELNPKYAEAHNNLAIALSKDRKFVDSLRHYGRALELRSDYPDARMNRALTYLLTGDFERGWEEYEWRWKCKDFNPRPFSQPRWDGAPLDGRRILLHTEQGLGDSFQFVRYAQLVKDRGGHVVVRCPRPLATILRFCPGVDEVCIEGDELPAFDVHLPLLSLPHIFRTTLATIPAPPSYLNLDQALIDHWAQELAYIRGFKVGINWQGNPKYRGDRHRSIPLAHFASLAAVPNVRLISLQKGFGTEQLKDARFSVTTLGGQIDEARGAFMDTAAIMKNLDLVVTSDTALAHLAGALGVRVWLALPYAPDWRWLLNRDDCPWYPNTRLFRQRSPGDWQDVFNRAAGSLMTLVHRRDEPESVPTPPADSERMNSLGVELVRSSRLDEAIASFRSAIGLRPDYPEALNNLGNALRATGESDEAISLLRRALTLREDYPDAHFNLGLALARTGELDLAIAEFRRALELKPDYALAHNGLGKALYEQKKFDDAIPSFREAIRLQPQLANAHSNLGQVYIDKEQLDDAIECFREATRIQPNYAEAFNNLGNALRERGQLDESIQSFESALRCRPDYAEAFNNRGISLGRAGQLEQAIASYEQALRLKPQYAAAHNNIAIALANSLRFDEAITHYHQALEINPQYAEALNNLAIVLSQRGRFDEAVEAYHKSLAIRPNYPEAHSNLGIALTESARTDEALYHYGRALELRSDYPDARMNRALTYLLTGDFERGWEEYEWRWKCKDFNPRPFSQPRWDGAPLDGRRILLHTEQGLGDSFQFVRYAQLVKDRGGHVVVRCPRPLATILRFCPGVDEVCIEGDELPAFDVHLPLLSLPHIFRTTLATIPAPPSYLNLDQALIDHWAQELAYIRGFKVGINWQGNPKYRGDRHRSIPLAHFASLAAVPNVRLISLQKGFGTEQLKDARFSVTTLGGQIDEARGAFMDTAAIMKNLDLVVTSDTALAHLAGALGVRVWLALPYAPDWRWLLNRDDCPWYPNTRLFRQTKVADWESVFARMGDALIALSGALHDSSPSAGLSSRELIEILAGRMSQEARGPGGANPFKGVLERTYQSCKWRNAHSDDILCQLSKVQCRIAEAQAALCNTTDENALIPAASLLRRLIREREALFERLQMPDCISSN
jgi:tetratricopeptide (TPR) repeat protein/uncharacterized C2H2 Zn-finger protein